MSNNDRYLWLGLEAGLWPSYVLEHRLANALADAGRDVTMIECQGVLKAQCPVMTANHIPVNASAKARRPICGDCRHNASLVQSRSRYSSLSLDAYVTDEIRAEVAALMAGVTVNNWSDLTVDGIPVGRYATYLTLLHHKLPDVTSSDDAWSEYLADLRNALLVLKALPAMLQETRPTHLVVYNPLYPTHRMVTELALRNNIQLVSVTAANYLPSRYDTALVFPRIESSQTLVDSKTISGGLNLPCSDIEVTAVGLHLKELISGSDPWVYSSAPTGLSPARVRERLGIRPESPVVTALVSSPDETRASEFVDAEFGRDLSHGVSGIPEFIQAVVQAARDLPDLDFVIRLHPRLLPNKRELVASPDLAEIEQLLLDLPSNAVINSPDQQLSLYDAIRISSVAVNQSSSAGLEFLALGLPVVQYDSARQNAYPPGFGFCVPRYDPPAFARSIEDAIDSGWNLENSRKAFRWYATIMLRATLHLFDLAKSEPEIETAISQPAPIAVRNRRTVRSLIPATIREVVSRRMAREGRAKDLSDDRHSTDWSAEWLARVDSLDSSGVIWEPLIVPRGHGDEASETERLTRTVDAFISRVTAGGEDGLGSLRYRRR